MQVSALILLVVAGLIGSSQAEPVKNCTSTGLLERIQPLSYDTKFMLDVDRSRYRGLVRLRFSVNETNKGEPKNQIVLSLGDELELFWDPIHVIGEIPIRSHQINAVDSCYDSEKQLAVITLAEDLQEGFIGVVTVNYESKLTHDLGRGIHLCKQTGHDDPVLRMDMSLGPSQVIPCIDDAKFKTTFKVTVTNEGKYKADSFVLMPHMSYGSYESRTTVFKDSRPMYLKDVDFHLLPKVDNFNETMENF